MAQIQLLLSRFCVCVCRSQVVREACVTIAYMSQQLQHKMDHFAEALLNNLVVLIPNSAKVDNC